MASPPVTSGRKLQSWGLFSVGHVFLCAGQGVNTGTMGAFHGPESMFAVGFPYNP
jgi:hypothetical protein